MSGTVPSTLSLTVTPSSSASSLELIPGMSYTDILVATSISALTNSPAGLRVSVTSTWVLTSGSNTIPIRRIGDALTTSPVATTNIAANSAVPYVLNVTKSTVGGNAPNSRFFIDYNVPFTQAKGNYTGLITFTASDN